MSDKEYYENLKNYFQDIRKHVNGALEELEKVEAPRSYEVALALTHLQYLKDLLK